MQGLPLFLLKWIAFTVPVIKISRLSITVCWMNCKVLLKHPPEQGIARVLLLPFWAVPLQLSLSPQFIQLLPLWKSRPSTLICASHEVKPPAWVPEPKGPITETVPLIPHQPPQGHFIDLTILTTLGSFLPPSCQCHPILGNLKEVTRAFLDLSLL